MKSKIKSLHVYIICNNRQVKEYDINASRKFHIGDETYVIKENCCYLKKIKNELIEVSYYIEGNPNPFDLKNIENNTGLTSKELDNYVGSDIFNILVECQSQQDRSKYMLQFAVFVFIFGFISLIDIIF